MVVCQSELLRFSSRVATLKSVVAVAKHLLAPFTKILPKIAALSSRKIAVFFILFLVGVAQSDRNASGTYMHQGMRVVPIQVLCARPRPLKRRVTETRLTSTFGKRDLLVSITNRAYGDLVFVHPANAG